MPNHRRRDRHVEQLQPAVHLAEDFAEVRASLMNGLILQSWMYRQLAVQIVAQQLLVEAAHVRQDGQLPLRVFDQRRTPCSDRPELTTIGNARVTEVHENETLLQCTHFHVENPLLSSQIRRPFRWGTAPSSKRAPQEAVRHCVYHLSY